MRLIRKLLDAIMLVAVLGAGLWVVALLTVAGHIYITKSIPYGFSDWIVDVQTRSQYWPRHEPQSCLFYVVRFWAFTGLVVLAGAVCAIYLRRRPRARAERRE